MLKNGMHTRAEASFEILLLKQHRERAGLNPIVTLNYTLMCVFIHVCIQIGRTHLTHVSLKFLLIAGCDHGLYRLKGRLHTINSFT